MLIYHWENRLECGVALIDEQHRTLFAAANTFFIRYKCGLKKASAQKCMEFLRYYILYHFQTEESYQVESGYSEYRSHQAMHSSLSTQVRFYAVKLTQSDYAEEVMEEFFQFLTRWLREHILIEDLKFSEHYHKYLEQK